MARNWFRPDNCQIGVTAEDIPILNRATRRLVDHHNLSPSEKWLFVIRQTYKPGMSANDLIAAVNETRD